MGGGPLVKGHFANNCSNRSLVINKSPVFWRNFGSSGKCVSGFMKSEKLEHEKVLIAEALRLAVECFALVVRARHTSVVDRVRPPTPNAAPMPRQGLGHLL